MNRARGAADNSESTPTAKKSFTATELPHNKAVSENEEPMNDSEKDDNQDDIELFLVDDDGEDFNELAAETSSLASSDSSGFGCSDQGTITAIRLRPMLPSEKKSGYRSIVDMNLNNDYLVTRVVNPTALPPLSRNHTSARYSSSKVPVTELTPAADATNFPAQFTQDFKFDYSYWSFDHLSVRPIATQSMVYDDLGVLALEALLQGQNCSLFAYGQPGGGKTYTMMGSGERTSFPASANANSNAKGSRVCSTLMTSERRGLIPRICQGLFAELNEGKDASNSYTLIMSYLEIYDERVYDLLSQAPTKKSLKVREHPEEGAFAERAQRIYVTSYSQVVELIEKGNRTRAVTSSQGKSCPSRSHTVLTLSLSRTTLTDAASLSSTNEGIKHSVKSKLCLVDLASSERMDHSGTNGLSLREAASINRSLATLADVVGAVAKRRSNRSVDGSQVQKAFVPYRNSVLTRLLKESLGGRAKTIMLGAISPCCVHYEETVATLRYIERTKSIYGTIRSYVDTNGDTTGRLSTEAKELKSNLCDSALDKVPSAMIHAFCGIPEHYEGCVECESCDPRSSNDGSLEMKPPINCEQEVSSLEDERDELSTCENEVPAESGPDCPQELDTSDEMLRKSVILLKLVAICQRCQSLNKYRALNQWRKLEVSRTKTIVPLDSHQFKMERDYSDHNINVTFLPSSGRKVGCPPLHTRILTAETRTDGRVQDVVAAVVTTDAICCSVVQEFLFPNCENSREVFIQHTHPTASTSLLELLASSSEFDRSDFRLNSSEKDQYLDEFASPLAESWRDLSFDEFSVHTEFGAVDLKEGQSLKDNESRSSLMSPGNRYEESLIYSALSLCVDSIDMARRSLGPGELKLRRRTKDDKQMLTGVECELLRYLDKRLVLMTRFLEDLMKAPRTHPETRAPPQSGCENLETLLSEFCLQIVARLCDQLPSASSACVAGRLQLETQLEQFSNRIKQFLFEAAIGWGDIKTKQDENELSTVFCVATELLVMTERIKLVWNVVDHRKRERLLHAQVLEALTIKESKNAATVAALEETNAELSVRCETLAACGNRVSRHPNENLEHLGVSNYADNLGSKLAVEVARTRDVQTRNDELLCRFATLNRALATASARVSALEAENCRLSVELQASICNTSTSDAASSQATLVILEALRDRVALLQKELDNANKHAHDLENHLFVLQNTESEKISELQSVKALLACEVQDRKSAEADLALMKTQMLSMKHHLDVAEARVKELEQQEARGQESTAEMIFTEAKNVELSASLEQAEEELLMALERACQAERNNEHRIAAIENLNTRFDQAQTLRELAAMEAEELRSKLEYLKAHVSGQPNQMIELEMRIRQEDRKLLELQAKFAEAMGDRDKLLVLLSETEEALASACGREKVLTSQLDSVSARELVQMNRVRGELHEATLEMASLREELTELLDHSTLQSATIDTLKLKQSELLRKADELELDRDGLLTEKHALERQVVGLECCSRFEKQLETERQESMFMHEALQRHICSFLELKTQQHSIEMAHVDVVRQFEERIEALSSKVQMQGAELAAKTDELKSAHEYVSAWMDKLADQAQSSKALLLEQSQESRSLSKQLHECQMDLHASTQRWVRAETQSGALRVCVSQLNNYLTELKEAYLMQIADTESARLRDDSCRMPTDGSCEANQTLNDHLSSLDAWFEEVISGNQPDSITDASSANADERCKSMNEDYAAQSSLLKTLTDLSALTSELLTVCEGTPEVDDAEDVTKGIDRHDASVDTYDLVEKLLEKCVERKESLTQNTKMSIEVVQLRKIVMKLKEALDAKDDMLLFLDGKVRALELQAT